MIGITKAVEAIQNAIDSVVIPAPKLPPELLWCISVKRPGISFQRIAAEVIKMNAQCGIPTIDAPDGSENLINQLCFNMSKAIVDEIKTNGVVDSSIPVGAVVSVGTGGNAGGPVTVTSTNILSITSEGIPR